MKEVIEKWELILKTDKDKGIDYSGVVLTEMFNDFKNAEKLRLCGVSGSAFTILNKGGVFENILFKTPEEARNYIKMKYPRRSFKEPQENVFVCTTWGTKFIIEEQHYR